MPVCALPATAPSYPALRKFRSRLRIRVVWWGDEAATLIFCPVVFRQLADGAGFSGMFRLVSLHTRGWMPVSSQPGQPGVEPDTVRLPGRFPEVTPGAAVPGLAGKPELAAAISGGMALLWA